MKIEKKLFDQIVLSDYLFISINDEYIATFEDDQGLPWSDYEDWSVIKDGS
jgi:hypothetical protein